MVGACSVCGYAVDWARACHTSKWRIFKGSTRLVSGFHYFAASDKVPHYPGVHPFGSRDWFGNQPTITPKLGEYLGPREFYSGEPPATQPALRVVGSSTCIAEGLDPGTVSILGRSPFCGRIMPPGCYEAVDELDDSTNHANCQWGYEACKIVHRLSINLADGIAAAVAYFGPTATVTGVERGNVYSPRHVIVRIRDHCFLFCEGTQMWTQWGSQLLSASWGTTNQGTYGTLPVWQLCANVLTTSIGTVIEGVRRFVLVGHSLGGASCSVAAANLKDVNVSRVVELVTFGSPKPGDQRLIDKLMKIPGTHYVNEGDPVPYVPPQISRWELLNGLIAGMGWTYPQYPFERHHRIVLVTNDFKLRPIRSDYIEEWYMENALVHIIENGNPFAFAAHSLERYRIMISRSCPCAHSEPDNVINAGIQIEEIVIEDMDSGKQLLTGSVETIIVEDMDGGKQLITESVETILIEDKDSGKTLYLDGDPVRETIIVEDKDSAYELTTTSVEEIVIEEPYTPDVHCWPDVEEIAIEDLTPEPAAIAPGSGDILPGPFLGDVTIDRTAYGGISQTWTGLEFTWSSGGSRYLSEEFAGSVGGSGKAAVGFQNGAWRIAARVDGAITDTGPTMSIMDGPYGTASGEVSTFSILDGGLAILTISIYPMP